SDLAETQATFGSKSNTSSITTFESNDFVSCDNSDKSLSLKTYDFASCVSSSKTNDSFFTVDVKLLTKSDVKDPSLTNGLPSCSFKENVIPPRNLCNKSGTAERIPYKNNFARIKKCFVYGSKSHLIKDCNVYDTVDNFPSIVSKAASVPAGGRNSSASTFVGRSIPAASKNRSASIHAGRSIPAASRNRPASIHAGTRIPAGRINKLAPFPAGSSVPTGWTNPTARSFFGPTTLYFDNVYWPGIYDHMSMNEGRWGSAVMSSAGGTVTFGGRDGKITGRGTIRTSKLDFENVYYVEELQNFNLFSVSQICDKKNKVLFTDDKCLVLTKEFQLLDESQNDGTCEFQDNKKLAKHGLVEGLPLKLFTDEHNCVAYNKGKQHKALYKAISAVAERKKRTLIEAARSMLADSKLPTMFWTEAVSTACYVLNRVSITNPHNKTSYDLLSGKVPKIQHLKPFGCQVTILNTSDHLGKFEGKANDGFLVGYAAHSTHDTNLIAGTQADDLESECDEQVILVPSFPSNNFSGPTVHDVSAPMENNLDYAEELARLQREEYEAHSVAAKHGFEFSVDTAALLPQAKIEIRRNLVLAAGDLAGIIVSTGGVPAGSVPASGVPAGSVPTSSVPAGRVLAGSIVFTGGVTAGSVPASGVPASSVPTGGVLAGSIVFAEFGNPAASASVPAVLTNTPAALTVVVDPVATKRVTPSILNLR
nr:ribonuclease H-like domain-containing protein [Tanacetum cinerariifolium]